METNMDTNVDVDVNLDTDLDTSGVEKGKSIKTRLTSSFMLVIIFMVAIAGISLGVLLKVSSDYKNTIQNYGNSQGFIGKWGIVFGELRTEIRNYCLETDTEEMEVIRGEIERLMGEMNKYIRDFDNYRWSEDEKSIFQELKTAYDTFVAAQDEVDTYARDFKNRAAFDSMKKNQLEPSNTIKECIDDLLDLQVKGTARAESSATLLTYILIGVIILCTVGAALIALRRASVISQQICNPLNEIVTAADNMANGNLGIEINITTEDEIGSLANSFKNMVDNLNRYINEIAHVTEQMSNYNMATQISGEFVGDFLKIKTSINNFANTVNDSLLMIRSAAKEIAIGSGQVAEGAQSLAEGTTEEAGVIEELVAMVENVSGKVSSNAENAKSAGKLSKETESVVELGTTQMQAMIKAMEDIQSSTNEIGAIIKSIGAIASQTNLLSLNASIEAARAGEAGRGFAVVAGEIGSLAEQSDRATKDTAALIEKCINVAKVGAETVEETAKTLSKIVESTKSVGSLVLDISEASVSQAQALDEVVTGINQVSTVIQSNSAISEESAAASEELSSQADLLSETVSHYVLRD